jgi:hypothetical protein
VSESTVKVVAAVPLNVTPVVPVNPVPVITTDVPTGALVGAKDVIAGTAALAGPTSSRRSITAAVTENAKRLLGRDFTVLT